jgi:PIN domain nuclease of toxin-antitoxin system
LLGLTAGHLPALRDLPSFAQHRDPFDHLIIARAVCEDMVLVTRDRNAALYPVRILSA